MLFKHSDALRKLSLSIRPVGLLDCDDERAEHLRREKREKQNKAYEKTGFGLLLFGSILQLIASTWSIL